MDYMEKPINHYLIIVVRLVNYLGYLVESLFFNRQNSRNVGNSLGVIIIFSTDAFARRECSLLLPPVKEGRGIIQLRYAPRS